MEHNLKHNKLIETCGDKKMIPDYMKSGKINSMRSSMTLLAESDKKFINKGYT